MLAGIMAVSMLAACGEGKGNGSSSSSSSEVPTVGGYTATIYDSLSKPVKEVLQTKSNSVVGNMANAAKAAYKSEYFGDLTDATTATNDGNEVLTETNNTSAEWFIMNAVNNEMGAKYRLNGLGNGTANKGTTWSLYKNNGAEADGIGVGVFAFDADTVDSLINKVVADSVATVMNGKTTNNSGADRIDYYLTAEKVTAGEGQSSITFVVVAIERVTTKG